MFAGLLHCADCGSKLYYAAAKSIKEHQEFYRCSQYKENRGACTINLNVFLNAIRECTELIPTLVNTLIKRIDVHNSAKYEHGHKRVPINIYFAAVGIINIPTEEELIATMEEMREKPLKSA